MSDLQFKPAVRGAMKLLIGLFGKSGGGKTLSGLYLARGIVGPKGKIGLVDTENKRGSVFLDIVPGSYEVMDFQPPFSPQRYCEAMDVAEKQGVECLVIDSASHEWLGEGGYLDLKEQALTRMAGEDYKKREKCAMAAAAQVKPKTHSKFVQKVLRCQMSVILCFRAHEKVRMDKQNGETSIKVDETPSPMQDGDLIYEMLIAGEVYKSDGVGGFFRIHGPHCKHTHPSILKLLPEDGKQIGIEHGEALAKWCAAPGSRPATKQPDGIATLESMKRRLWESTRKIHGCSKGDKDKARQAAGVKALNQWMVDESVVSDTEAWETLTAERLPEIISKAEAKLGEAVLV